MTRARSRKPIFDWFPEGPDGAWGSRLIEKSEMTSETTKMRVSSRFQYNGRCGWLLRFHFVYNGSRGGRGIENGLL